MSKEFDEKLQISNFQLLETEYQNAKNSFLKSKGKISNYTYDQIESKFPAFVYCKQSIMLKFPTYKIRVIINNHNSINCNQLSNLLNFSGKYEIYEETNVVLYPSLEPVRTIAIQCLEDNLKMNDSTAKNIQSLLDKNGINSQKCVTSGLYCIPIQVNSNDYFTVL